MTRAEVAQMFYNLLLNQDVAITVTFDDVADDAWYAEAVNTLASLGIVEGVGNNQFDPERAITRAEFTTIAMRFTNGMLDGENIFSDVSSSAWYYEYVVGAIQYGWINGYEDVSTSTCLRLRAFRSMSPRRCWPGTVTASRTFRTGWNRP